MPAWGGPQGKTKSLSPCWNGDSWGFFNGILGSECFILQVTKSVLQIVLILVNDTLF